MELIEQKWETVNKLFRNLGTAFEAKKGKHSKCPRCKGSGLLIAIGQSCWEQGHVPNEPCWFCEGVGVLPIVGLKGFILARASSHINTHDLMVQPLSPLSMETSVVEYMGTKCKIITYKPVEEECLTFSFAARNLPWLADFEKEAELNNADLLPNNVLCATQDSFSNSIQVKNETLFSTEWPSVIDSSQIPDTSHHANLNFVTEALDISKPYTDIQPQPFTASLLEKKCSLKHRQSNKGKIVDQLGEELDESKCLHSTSNVGCTPALNVFLVVSALKLAIQGKGLCQPTTCRYNDSIFTESGIRASIQFDVELPTIRHVKIQRKSRKVRNRIREKAQKEANESAQRILKHLTPRATSMSIAPPNEIPEGVWSIVSTGENEAMQIHVRSETSRRLPLFRFQHAQSIMDRVYAYNNLWMKSFHFQKDTGLMFTEPARTLKN